MRLKVDVIVTTGPIVNPLAKEATSTIPIVMAFDHDPVGNGLVTSLARPGGNVTGLSNIAPETTGKQLELLKEVVPRFSRIAVFGNTKEPATQHSLSEAEIAAKVFKLTLQYVDILSPDQLETGFRAATKGHAEALIILRSFVLERIE